MKMTRQTRLTVTALLAIVLLAGCNRGGGITAVPGGVPSSSAPSEVSSTAEVVKVSSAGVQLARNSSADAVVTVSIAAGYHVNANPATYPYLIATEVTASPMEGITVSKPIYPAAAKQKFEFAEEALAVYEGDAQIKVSLLADSKASPGARSLPIKVRVQACDHEKCYPPATLNGEIPVEVK